MRKLMMTSALVVPLLAGPVFAQETPPADATDEATQAPILEEENGAEGETVADDPAAETGEPALADDPAAETDEPALADDPAADADAPAMADDPAADADAPAMADDPAADADAPAMADDPAADTGTDAPMMADEDPALDADTELADEPAAPPSDAVVTEMGPNELRGDWVIGTTVTSPADETIGSIQDIIIDEEGRVTAAILSVGGFLGLGAKNIAVDFNQLQINEDGREITLDITREQAEEAPEYAFRDQVEPAPAPEAGMGAPVGGDPADPAAPPPAPAQ